MDRNRCENCGYYEKGEHTSFCLRHAPRLSILSDNSKSNTQRGVTDPKVWCSEFKDVKLHVRGENDSCRTCRHGYIRDNGQLTCGKNPPATEYHRFDKCWFLSVQAIWWCGDFEPEDVDHD